MKNFKTFEQFVNEASVNEAKYPSGKKYKIDARFEDRDDKDLFLDTWSELGAKKRDGYYVEIFANEKELVEIVKELKGQYGLKNKEIKLRIKGKTNGAMDFWLLDSQRLRSKVLGKPAVLSKDLATKLGLFE